MSPSLKDCFGKAVDKGAAAAAKVRGQRAVGHPNEVFGCELAGSDLSNHRHQWCCFTSLHNILHTPHMPTQLPRLKETIVNSINALEKDHRDLSELYSQGVVSGYTKKWNT
jgi:hypothetical protein